MVVFVLAVMGLGWKTFSSGAISGSETILDVGQPIVRNLTQESEEFKFGTSKASWCEYVQK